MMEKNDIINWLLSGDPSIRWQVMRDILHCEEKAVDQERRKISSEGWGARLLSFQDEAGMWDGQVYTPKWISTTYSLLLLRGLGMFAIPSVLKGCERLYTIGIYDGKEIRFSKNKALRDIGVSAMIADILSFFGFTPVSLLPLTLFLITYQKDGGEWFYDDKTGAKTYAFETTFLVLKALQTIRKDGRFRVDRLEESESKGREFLLRFHLYQDSLTRLPIKKQWTRFSFPNYWFYDTLSVLDYFREADVRDERMQDAINILRQKQKPDGMWYLPTPHPGKVFFEMEEVGKPSRWNTLRALRILSWWDSL
jgi:hypothetical protein